MGYTTISELVLILNYSIKHLNMLINLDISYDGHEIDYLNAAKHWSEHLLHLLKDYENTRNFAKNGRKFIVSRIHGFLR